MTLRKIFFLLLAGGFWLLAAQCAQIVNPNGGKKDKEPPRTLKYRPDSAQVNFSADKITITFNEYIQLADLQKQLVISPPMNKQPEITAKGKTLTIELKDTLKRNTTYVFNFGDAVQDITENNPRTNFQYVFSTGGYIDSLTLTGTVKNAFDMKTEKGILVMLYDDYSDSVPSKKLPTYLAKTRDDGSYKINNIRPGTYKAFALKDANADYLYDLPTESIAFSDTLIKITKKTSLNLLMFREEPKQQKMLKASFPEHGHLVVSFAKPTNDSLKLHFFSQEPKGAVVYEYSKNTDTLHYWFAEDLKDTMKIQVLQGDKILDTIRIKPVPVPQIGKGGRGDKWELRARTNIQPGKPFDVNRNIELKFSHPLITDYKESQIGLKEDSLDIPHEYKKSKVKLNISFVKPYRTMRINKTLASKGDTVWNENTQYRLFIPPGTFTDIFGLKNDTIKLNFKTPEENSYGSIKLSLKMKIRIAYILELMNEKGEVIEAAGSDNGVFTYTFLPPGAYKLRITYDKNGDGKWTPGNYQLKRKPETVIWYSGAITVRPGFETETDWKP